MGDRVADHAAHDRLLIAAHAAGDAVGEDARRAELLLEGCEDCRMLAGDLGAIASASRDLAGWHPARPRDYRLSAPEAAAARRGGHRARLASLLGLPGATLRQAGLGLATLGLVGILVSGAGLSGAGLGGATGGATRATGIEPSSGDARYGAQAAPTEVKAGASPGSALTPIGSGVADTREASPHAAAPAPVGGAPETTVRTIAAVASAVLLVAGILLLLAPAARRRRHRT